MEMRSRLLTGAVWISAARMISNLLGVLSTIVLAHLLIPSDFGLVALGTTFLVIITSITDVPLTEAVIQHRNPTETHLHTAFTLGITRAFIVAVVFAALAWPVEIIYSDPRLANVMMILAIGVGLGGFQNPRAIMMTKDLIFWQQFMLQVAQKLVALVVSIGIAVMYRSYWALLLGTLAGQVVSVAVSYTVIPFRPRLTFEHSRELLSFSLWLTLCQIAMTISFRLDQLLIGSLLSKTKLGYYVMGETVASLPTRETTTPLMTTIFPAFTRFVDDKARLASAYTNAQGLITAVALPLGVGLAIIADPLVRLLLGQKWLPAVFMIQVLAPVFAFQTIGTLAAPLAMAVGRPRLLFKRDVQSLVCRIPLILTGLYFGGLAGMICARAVSGTAGVMFTTNVVATITGRTTLQQLRTSVRALVSAAVLAVGGVAIFRLLPMSMDPVTNLEEILFLVPFGAFIYLSVTAALWQFAGRPNGPETEVLALAGKALRVLRPRPQTVHDQG